MQTESLAGPEAVLQTQPSQTKPFQQETGGKQLMFSFLRHSKNADDTVHAATAPPTGELSCDWVS